jgi:Right handed beta helix region
MKSRTIAPMLLVVLGCWPVRFAFPAEPVSPPASLRLFVATNGNDLWTGRLSAPNAEGTDGPLASLTGARNAVRKLRGAPGAKAVTVLVRAGTYRMEMPLVLEPRDSGTAQAPVVYTAFPGERPVCSGGRVITGWRVRGRLWEAALADPKRGQWSFHQLFANNQRRQRARSPNSGYFRVAKLLPGPMDAASKQPVRRDGFGFRAGDLAPYARLGDVDVVLMHSWETSIHPLKSVDTNLNIVQFTAPLKEWWSIGYWEKAQRYYVENALELLDQPGEWYLNRDTWVLSYWPMPGEEIGRTELVAPRLSELVRFDGDPGRGRFVEYVTLRGLCFQDADWQLDPRGNSSTQAAVEVPAVITANGARHCAIEKCEIAHIGTYGLWLRRGCKECRVRQNRLFDLGAGGIRVGEANRAATDAAESSHNWIDNNLVFDGGRVYPAGIGIWVAQSSHNRISHNDIHDLLYSGMSIGWNWDDTPNRTHDNVIEFNHVHNLGHGVLSDAGLIYCLGASPGSVIRNNVFHDMWPYSNPPFGWGIYFDATCSGYLCESNVVYNTRSGGVFWNNGGHQHVIQNNIFALSADYAVWPYWERRPNTFRHNIVYLTQGALLVGHAEGTLQQRRKANEPLGTWDDNIYWDTRGPDRVRFFNHSFSEWQRLGLDQHSVIADPGFEDLAKHDFRLKSDSPALARGFHQIDTSAVGLYGDPAWKNQVRHENCPHSDLPPPSARTR